MTTLHQGSEYCILILCSSNHTMDPHTKQKNKT